MRKSILFVSLLLASPGFAQPKAPTKAPSQFASLRDYVSKTAVKQAYGLYMMGQKVGWMTIETGIGQWNGREVSFEKSAAKVSLRAGSQSSGLEFNEQNYYSLQGDGPLLASNEMTKQDGTARQFSARRQKDVLVISSPGTAARTIKANNDSVRQGLNFYRWLNGNPAVGAKFDFYSTELSESQVNTKQTYIYRGRKSIVWGGVPTTVHQVRLSYSGATFDSDIKSDGMPLTGRIAGILELRAEEWESAQQMGKGIDLLAASAILANKSLGETTKLQKLSLAVTGDMEDFTLPSSARQRVTKEKDRLLVQLSRDTGEPATLTAPQRASALAETPDMPVKNERLQKLARQLVGTIDAKQEPVRAASEIRAWVYGNLRKTMASNASSALDVLANRAGDCTEHSLLYVTLCRAAGIPAREVSGLVYYSPGKPQWGWHAWAEVYDGSKWLSMDPTWNQTGVDVGHLKFASDDDLSWVNALGRVKLEILETEPSVASE